LSYWGAIISAVGSLYSNSQQNKAAGKQQQGAQAGLDWLKSVYGDAQGNFAPYLSYGQGAGGLGGLSALAGGNYDGFLKSPDYMAARDAMNYGLDHSAAARGSLYSGGYQADLSHAQGDLASQYLGNYRNSLFQGAGLGMTAASNLGSIGNGLAAGIQNGYNGVANAQATGYGANAGLATGLAGLFNNYWQGRDPQQQTGSSYSGQGYGTTWGTGESWNTPNYNTNVGWVDYNHPGDS
jgi:hypothetical protein